MNAEEVLELIRIRYAAPEWVLLRGVGNGTGSDLKGWADAIGVNLYRSKGWEIDGFEIKVSRSDLLRELKKPDKAENMARFCDRGWLVVSDRRMVEADELPPSWGVLAPSANGRGLTVIKRAPTLANPEPVTRSFMAAVLRRHVGPDDQALAKAMERGTSLGYARARGELEAELAKAKEQAKAAEERRTEIERALRLRRYDSVEEFASALEAHRVAQRTEASLADAATQLERGAALLRSMLAVPAATA